MSKITTATIEPITADKLMVGNLEEIQVPIEDPDIFEPKIVSMCPVIVTPETLEHAEEVARQIIEMMPQLPATPLSGDLLTLALTVLHYKG